ncbi:glycosyltransferase family 4 protein [Pontibacter arcticus]|uniref:Uncharacterized protein n=1 Tax=Pontibacter arcticus TaxID=2080288 RepID=A0A364RG17_9BACT|nr:glycosyltransferase family 4 protein [Pontibacter arcticus]RAU83288.1 hypothetical protein DP923_08760 [Pontibacter arcticus]
MKILYYSSHPHLNLASPAGYGTHIREMIHAFGQLGHDVKPVIMGGTTINEGDLSIKGRSPLKQMAASMVPSFIWETAKDHQLLKFDKYAAEILEEEIQQFQPDLIYERAAYLQTSGVEAAVKHRIQHVLEVNAPYAEERVQMQGNSFYAGKGVEIEKKLLKGSTKIAVVSSALQKHLSTTYHIEADKFILTPNAINPAHINYSLNRASDIKEALKITHKTVIGFVGSIFPWHGIDLLIKAFKTISASDSSLHLLIVGDGETLPLLKNLVQQEQLQDVITFTGNIKHQDVFNYIACMDICVMPTSNWYGSPVKIFEYAAMGKAVIAPDNIPVKDVMHDQITGLLIQPDVDSLKTALNQFIENKSLRESCAHAFKRLVLTNYTWVKNAEKVISSITCG